MRRCHGPRVALLAAFVAGCTSTLPLDVVEDDAGPTGPPDADPSSPLPQPGLGGAALGPEFPFDQPVNAADLVTSPSIDCGSAGCLIAWSNGHALRAARLDQVDHHPLDATGVAIAPEELLPPHPHQGPFVVADRDRGYFVIWSGPREASGKVLPGTSTTYVVHVTPDGAASQPRPIDSAGHAFEPTRPISVARGPLSPVGDHRTIYLLGTAISSEPRLKLLAISCDPSSCGEGPREALPAPGLIPGSAALAALVAGEPVVGWLADDDQSGMRVELRRPASDRSLQIARPGGRLPQVRPRPLALTRVGGTLVATWIEIDTSDPSSTTVDLLASRIDAAAWKLRDAEPVEVARGKMRLSSLLDRPQVVAAGDQALIATGDWLADAPPSVAEDTLIGRWLPATGDALQDVRCPDAVVESYRRVVPNALATHGDRLVGHLAVYPVQSALFELPSGGGTLAAVGGFLGGGSNAQTAPQVACNAERCAVAWVDSRAPGVRGVRVDPATGRVLDAPAVELFGGPGQGPGFALATDGTDFLVVRTANESDQTLAGACAASPERTCALIEARRWRAGGDLEPSMLTELVGSRPTPGSWIGARHDKGAYVVVVEQLTGRGLYLARLADDGSGLGEPLALGPGGQAAMTVTARGTLVVYHDDERFVARPIAADGAGPPVALPSTLDRRDRPALVTDGEGQTWLSWIARDGARREQRIDAVELDADGAWSGEPRAWATVDALLDDHVTARDAHGPLLAFASRPFKSSPQTIRLLRPRTRAREANGEPLLLAEGVTTPGIALSSLRAGLFLTAYLRHGQSFGTSTHYSERASRIVGRFVQLPGLLAPN